MCMIVQVNTHQGSSSISSKKKNLLRSLDQRIFDYVVQRHVNRNVWYSLDVVKGESPVCVMRDEVKVSPSVAECVAECVAESVAVCGAYIMHHKNRGLTLNYITGLTVC